MPERWVGHYRIVRPLGAGGMGEVFLAQDSRLDRLVALKVLPPVVADDPIRRQRFVTEAKAASALNHPNVCTIFEAGETPDGRLFISMEFVEGQTLDQASLTDPAAILRAGIQIAGALEAAHSKGILHRDIKPANICLNERGDVKILDFGLAKRVEAASDSDPNGATQCLTREGHVIGTPNYMSPEQALGRPLDPRTDIFSMGSVLYRMLAGRPPFSGLNLTETIDKVLHQPPEPIQRADDRVSEELERIILKCLEKRREDRYQTSLELLVDLRNLKRGMESSSESIRTRSLKSPGKRRNLPSALTPFVGREKDRAEVRELLAVHRLVTLVGVGGTGKTRLALMVASHLSDQAGETVYYVDLAPVGDPDLVGQMVAKVVGLKESPSLPWLELLAGHFQEAGALILLDNCEHLIDACAALADALLRQCPRLRFLATSREALNVAGEIAYAVRSLSVPPSGSEYAPAQMLDFEAVRLFVGRAVEHRTAFRLNESNVVAVADICRRLDGIPLALEMAAARLKVLAPHQLAQRLSDRFRVLTGTSRSALSRHQTLKAVLDWSHDLLGDRERVLLRRLAVFSDGFTLEAAESVCSDDTIRPEETLDVLDHLVSKSMVQTEPDNQETRYRLLETVRQYARDRLLEAAEGETFRKRHLEFFLGFARDIEPALSGPNRVEGMDKLEREHNNIRAILALALEQEDWLDPGLELASAIRQFWWVRGYLTEGRGFFRRAFEQEARIRHDPTKAAAFYSAAMLAFCQTDYLDARALCERGLPLFQHIDDPVSIARSRNLLGNVAKNLGEPDVALEHYRQCLSIGEALGHASLKCRALDNLGELALWTKDYPLAKTHLEQSLAIARSIRDDQLITWCLDKLGAVALGTGDLTAAANHLQTSLSMAGASNDKRALTYGLEGFARLFVAQGRMEQAALLFGKTQQLRADLTMPLHMDERGRHDEAVAACRHGLRERFDGLLQSGTSLSQREAIDLTR